jgi:hypothetical protein
MGNYWHELEEVETICKELIEHFRGLCFPSMEDINLEYECVFITKKFDMRHLNRVIITYSGAFAGLGWGANNFQPQYPQFWNSNRTT